MSIIAGYIRQSDGVKVQIGSYDSIELAEGAISNDASADVSDYWLARYFDAETNEAGIFAYIDP